MTESDFTYPDDLEVLSLGQPSQLAAKVLARIAEDGGTVGCLFEIDRHGMLLIYHMMPGVTPAEQEALRSGPIKLSIGETDGHIHLVLQCEQGDYEMSYEPAIIPVANRPDLRLDELIAEPKLRFMVTYHLFDTLNLHAKALRAFTLSNHMSKVLARLVAEHSASGEVMDRDEHVKRVLAFQSKYTIKDLAKRSLAYTKWSADKETGGVNE